MHILMMTNTFSPHVGGVARSVEAFTRAYRQRGHRVLVVAPEFENMPEHEVDVARVPAVQHFNGSDFSVMLPFPAFLTAALDDFAPDVVHSHHPFLIGATAVRIASYRKLPLVFTHHTMYERYTHYVPGDSQTLKRFVIDLATSYANLCDEVFAPSGSIAAVLRDRGVTAPIQVIPTGVDVAAFASPDAPDMRQELGIPADAFVIGHLGRLAPEKNIEFLCDAVIRALQSDRRARFLVAGKGPSEAVIHRSFAAAGLEDRLHMAGSLGQPRLAGAYQAMDVFVFASTSETQGMVLTEAMAAGVPVVAVDAPGAREVVADGRNGRLLPTLDVAAFAAALAGIGGLTDPERQTFCAEARATAEAFSIDRTAEQALERYQALQSIRFVDKDDEYDVWHSSLRMIQAEWEVLRGVARAAGTALNLIEGNGKPQP